MGGCEGIPMEPVGRTGAEIVEDGGLQKGE